MSLSIPLPKIRYTMNPENIEYSINEALPFILYDSNQTQEEKAIVKEQLFCVIGFNNMIQLFLKCIQNKYTRLNAFLLDVKLIEEHNWLLREMLNSLQSEFEMNRLLSHYQHRLRKHREENPTILYKEVSCQFPESTSSCYSDTDFGFTMEHVFKEKEVLLIKLKNSFNLFK